MYETGLNQESIHVNFKRECVMRIAWKAAVK